MLRLPATDSLGGYARRKVASALGSAVTSAASWPGLAREVPRALADLPAVLVELPGALRTGERAVRRLDDLASRVDVLVSELEDPVRDLAPGLRRLARALDDPVVEGLPGTVARLEAEIVPAVASLRETQARVAAIAASTERITTFVDDAGTRIGSLPGLLLRRPFRAGEPVRDYPGSQPLAGPVVDSADGDDDQPGGEPGM